jgi:DNA-binding transcriptional MerR regulator
VFTIGDFSKITGLTVKTLRFYHDRGLLIPAWVDKQTGYRFYESRQIDKARIITQLRSLEFSLEQIGEMLANSEDEADILAFLERQRTLLEERMRLYRGVVTTLPYTKSIDGCSSG